MLPLLHKYRKNLLCNIYRISRDSIYRALSYHKHKRQFCAKKVYTKLWFWTL